MNIAKNFALETKKQSGGWRRLSVLNMEDNVMKINEIIRTRRKELKLTQEQAAEYLGISAPAVNKWEKGVSYPDITLLPPLARLLKVDLNTLLSFEEELTDEEINHFCSRIFAVLKESGYKPGHELAVQKIKEYPNSYKLIYNLAGFLKGALLMFPTAEEDKAGYEEEIRELFKRVARDKEADWGIRGSALNMLVGDYIQMEEYDKAEELLAEIPDLGVDKRPMLTLLYRKQGKTEEAVKLTQRKLLQAAGDVQNCLIVLMEICKEQGCYEGVEYYGGKHRDVVELLDLWEYGKYVADYSAAVAEKDADRTLEQLEGMLESMGKPWDLGKSRLYDKLAEQGADNGQQKEVFERMRNGMLKEIEKGEEFDFLRDRQEFKDLFAKFREAADRP